MALFVSFMAILIYGTFIKSVNQHLANQYKVPRPVQATGVQDVHINYISIDEDINEPVINLIINLIKYCI